MSDGSRVGLAYVAESTFGTTPSGPPTLKNLRYVSETLEMAADTVESEEVRSDRQTADLILVGARASGQIVGELSWGAYDDFFEAALCSPAWTAAVLFTVTQACTIAAAGSNFTITRASGSFITDGLNATTDVGQWIRFGAWVQAANNTIAKIVSVTATVLTVSHIAMTVETSVTNVTFKRAAQILASTTFRSFAIERSYNDLASRFAMLNGMTIQGFKIGVAPRKVVDISFDFLGKRETSATATAGTGTNTAAPTNPVLSPVTNVEALFENGSSLGITNFELNHNNNLRERLQVAALGAVSIGLGGIQNTGNLQGYYDVNSAAIIDRFINQTATALALKIKDALGNRYCFEMPEVKFSKGNRYGRGKTQDVLFDLDYASIADPTELQTFRLSRWDLT